MRSRRDTKLNQTKKQLELLNELYRENHNDQIVAVVLCRKGIRRNWNTRNLKYILQSPSIVSRGSLTHIKLLEDDT